VKWAVASVLLGLGVASGPEAAGQDPPAPVRGRVFDERSEGDNPLRGSILLFEQSVTTQTAGVGSTPQSYVPFYELWLSFRPRFWFGEHFSLRGRFDYTKELTNDQTTTLYRQDVLGDAWTDAVYWSRLDSIWRETNGDAGLRAIWPTSLASQAASAYVQLGPRAGATHKFELRGDGAPVWNSAHVALRGSYLHTFSETTTPTDFGGFAYKRQNVDAFAFTSDQIAGETNISDVVTLVVEAGLQVTPRLTATAFGVVFDQWHHAPSQATIATATGNQTLSPVAGAQFTQNTWVVMSVDYLILDELELGIGYYNLANALAPDGTPRGLFGAENIWWSPDARFSLSATANLDVLYGDAVRPSRSDPKQAVR
jgi:hypothetical protein